MAEGGRLDLGTTPEGLDVARLLASYVRSLLSNKHLGVRAVVVIGSRARGEWEPWSDTDLLVIARAPQCEFPYTDEAVRASVELRVYTPEAFLKALWRLDLTALEAAHHGTPVYDDGFWGEVEREFREVKDFYGLVRGESWWKATRWDDVCRKLGLPPHVIKAPRQPAGLRRPC